MTYGEMTLGDRGRQIGTEGDKSEIRATEGDKKGQRGDKSVIRATEGDKSG